MCGGRMEEGNSRKFPETGEAEVVGEQATEIKAEAVLYCVYVEVEGLLGPLDMS